MALTAPILGGKKTAKLDENVFALEVNEPLLHEAVKAEAAAKRQGTHATKTRGQVAGGRAKPWRQKGTGRARQGTTRAAHWRGGGAIFGPHPRSYHLKMNRKAYRRARAIALSVHASRGTLAAFDAAGFDGPAHEGRDRPARRPRRPPAGGRGDGGAGQRGAVLPQPRARASC